MKEKLKKKRQERQRTLIKIMLQFLFDRFLDLKKNGGNDAKIKRKIQMWNIVFFRRYPCNCLIEKKVWCFIYFYKFIIYKSIFFASFFQSVNLFIYPELKTLELWTSRSLLDQDQLISSFYFFAEYFNFYFWGKFLKLNQSERRLPSPNSQSEVGWFFAQLVREISLVTTQQGNPA